jgi:acetyl esterase
VKPDPETTALLRLMAEAEYPPIWTLSAAEAREIHDPLTAASAHPAEPVAETRDLEIAPGLGVRVYRPDGVGGDEALLLYFHGGGGAIGDLDSHDAVCRTLANASGAVTVAVDYRLGPEHRFPAGWEDACTAWRWALENAGSLDADPARIAVGGDSAGGGLAASLAQRATAGGGPGPVFQLLIYPALDATRDAVRHPSVAENAEGYFLTGELMAWFGTQYLAPDQDLADVRLSPGLSGQLAGLPPALIVSAGLDPLRDEAAAYAAALERAGVAVDYRCFEETIHGFASFGRFLSFTAPAIRDWGEALRAATARSRI